MTNAAEKQKPEVYIGQVPQDKVPLVWPQVEPLLARVVKPHTGFDLSSVLMQLQMGRLQLWVINDFQACAVTQIQERPIQRVLWCQFIAGDFMDDWLDMWEYVQAEFARMNGCGAVEFSGRPGWRKFNAKYKKYKPVLTTYRMEL